MNKGNMYHYHQLTLIIDNFLKKIIVQKHKTLIQVLWYCRKQIYSILEINRTKRKHVSGPNN